MSSGLHGDESSMHHSPNAVLGRTSAAWELMALNIAAVSATIKIGDICLGIVIDSVPGLMSAQ
jgi:hypothetical protein